MKPRTVNKELLADLEALILAITAGASEPHEQVAAFHECLNQNVAQPFDAFVIGEPVTVTGFCYDGNVRRGLTAVVRREGRPEYVVGAAEIVLPQRAPGSRFLAAYRHWLGLPPFPLYGDGPDRAPLRSHKASSDELAGQGTVDLVVLSVAEKAARCNVLATGHAITLRSKRIWELAPGVIATVLPYKQWRFSGHPFLSGDIADVRIDVAALGLPPLRLVAIDEAQIGRPSARGGFELERVCQSESPTEPFYDRMMTIEDLLAVGARDEARQALMELCQIDLRCLEAHAQLGDLAFGIPTEAMLHYAVGSEIGEFSLASGFDGLLPSRLAGNRPFLRCLQGLGRCLWRLKRFDEADTVFERLLLLDPADDLGARFALEDVRAQIDWATG